MMTLISYYLKSFQKTSQVGSCCIISEASSICETAVIFFYTRTAPKIKLPLSFFDISLFMAVQN